MPAEDLFAGLTDAQRERVRSTALPAWIDPMLATLSHDPFTDSDWIFERKLDGVRCLAYIKGDTVRLWSRNRQRQDDTYPELVDALAAQTHGDCIVDGEIVAFDGKLTSFSRLQGRSGITDAAKARASGIAVYYYLFDLLYFDGRCLTDLPLRARKQLLRKALRFADPLRYTPHRNTDGESYLRTACDKGWEGVLGKRADSPYVGTRSRQWLKLKCVHRQEFVIGGFTEPKGSRIGFGALALGYFDAGELRYAGLVGTGFDDEQLRSLHKSLTALERERPAFDDNALAAGDMHWVTPDMVAQVGFTEWTADGKLRHPRFLGLRHDKAPQEVVREDTS